MENRSVAIGVIVGLVIGIIITAGVFVALPLLPPTGRQPVTITYDDSFTSLTTFEGSFSATGAINDAGINTGTFIAPGEPPLFARETLEILNGTSGAIAIKRVGTITFTSETGGTAEGTFEIVAGYGAYAGIEGKGRWTASFSIPPDPNTLTVTLEGEAGLG